MTYPESGTLWQWSSTGLFVFVVSVDHIYERVDVSCVDADTQALCITSYPLRWFTQYPYSKLLVRLSA